LGGHVLPLHLGGLDATGLDPLQPGLSK